jgi:hypothetical protein
MGAELFTQPVETAFVNQVVERHFSRKQSHGLDSQVEPLDINLALRAIACDDKKTEQSMRRWKVRYVSSVISTVQFSLLVIRNRIYKWAKSESSSGIDAMEQ